MNIYEAEGTDAIVDLRAAAAELKASTGITNDGVRRQIIAEISTAALLDIALSLRVVAAEARAAMPSPFVSETDEETPAEDAPRDFLVEGDLVVVEGMDEPGEIVRFGTTEGSIYAVVQLANGAEVRPWIEALTRLTGDEPDDETVEAIVESVGEMTLDREGEILAGADDEPDDDIEVESIDDDFEAEATTALDTLKAAKKSKKGGKK